MTTEKQKKILNLLSNRGVIRPRDLKDKGLSPRILYGLYRKGKVIRLARGLYASWDYEPTEHQSIIEVCSKIPKGVICLLSALQFHRLTTQLPREIWVAIDFKARTPKVDSPVRIMYFSGDALNKGIEKHKIEGVEVKVYSAAKTVADCFKYRNKIGLDVAIEALRDCLREKKATVDEIWKYAKVCRVANVIRPYLEASV